MWRFSVYSNASSSATAQVCGEKYATEEANKPTRITVNGMRLLHSHAIAFMVLSESLHWQIPHTIVYPQTHRASPHAIRHSSVCMSCGVIPSSSNHSAPSRLASEAKQSRVWAMPRGLLLVLERVFKNKKTAPQKGAERMSLGLPRPIWNILGWIFLPSQLLPASQGGWAPNSAVQCHRPPRAIPSSLYY